MLTKSDLTQIGKLLDQKFAAYDKIQSKRFAQVDKRFAQVDKRFAQVDKRLNHLETDVRQVKKDVTEIRKDTKTIVQTFDRDYLELRERVERIERTLNLQ